MATPDADAIGCLRVADQLELDGIELIIDDDYPCAVRTSASTAQVGEIAGAAGDLGLRVAALCSYTRDIDVASEQHRRRAVDELRRATDLAAEIGARHVRVLAGRDRPNDERADAMARAAATLTEVAGYARPAGINLNVENHMDTLATTAAATRELVAAAASPAVGVLYDQANLAIMRAEDPATAVQLQEPFIRHVHLKNFLPAEGGRRPVGLDAGKVDWNSTLRLLDGYTGTMTFEYERRWFRDQLPPVETVLHEDRDLVLSVAAELERAASPLDQ
ncbi:sugar phosphate isomerase/epimerase family protein [Phytoactinopolyspora halotolerans]|uniref:Sugar phosphate isomerase/epimerase n=1 Tax=Phytoactinopolyspora halotolerans TaxID=1981512 RepID=A0A6L9SGG8_9ACTN|nr:sugar phosphate isomerase/epimerase family protein [Phytoactinopolyspora halotolerans]NEE03481.1 sugar phosphate isomerase/epimerase [Phytoactinopolyspora halotolerans]